MKKILFALTFLAFSMPASAQNIPFGPLAAIRTDYSSTNVTTGAWVQLVASLGAATSGVEIFDSSGQTLLLGYGPSGQEVGQFIIFPGGNGIVPFGFPAGVRVVIKALSGTASSGESDINFYR